VRTRKSFNAFGWFKVPGSKFNGFSGGQFKTFKPFNRFARFKSLE
jgi:hypothetical protein